MKAFPVHPCFSEQSVGCLLSEVFDHPIFTNGTETERRKIMFKSSEAKYLDEIRYSWDNYFGMDLRPLLIDKLVLDLGCFTGGRSVAWAKRYKFSKLYGIDIKHSYIEAAKQFASANNVESDFIVSYAESLPFKDQIFDAILTFDVFEHVTNVQKTLDECYRVLKKGGLLFVVFPSYFHPMEHHLSLVTKIPFIHYFFTGKTLIKAYNEIIESRGYDANWYRRKNPELQYWERGNTINGTTFAKFHSMLKKDNGK